MSDDSHEYDEDALAFIEDERARISALHLTCPKQIWLQIDPEAEQFDGWEAQTWCSDQINDTDVRYVLAASRDAEVAELKESLRLACEIREGTTMGEQRLAYWLQLQSDNDQLREQVTLLRSLVPKRIPNGFVSFGKYYSEQEDKFNEPYNSMCKFKRKYLSDCEEALAATEPKEQEYRGVHVAKEQGK